MATKSNAQRPAIEKTNQVLSDFMSLLDQVEIVMKNHHALLISLRCGLPISSASLEVQDLMAQRIVVSVGKLRLLLADPTVATVQ